MMFGCDNVKIIKNISNKGLYVISVILFLYLSINSFLSTASTSFYSESTVYTKDNVIFSLIVLLFFLCFVIIIKSQIRNVKIKKYITIILLILNILIGYIWINLANIEMVDDRKYVYDSAVKLYNGDYSALYLPENFDGYGSFERGGYLYIWPHQTGLVFFVESLYSVFKENTIYIFQVINLLLLNIIFYIMAKIPKLFFDIEDNNLLSIIISFLCLPATFYCTFVYGNIISFCLSVISIYLWMLFVKEKNSKRKIILFIYSILSISLAYQIKITALIVVIALIIVNILQFIEKKEKQFLIYMIVLIIMYSIPLNLTQRYYEMKSGIEISEGISKLGWLETGLNDNGFSPGWYNYWPAYGIVEANLDNELYAELSKEHIISRLEFFKDNKVEMIKFFHKKNSSAWNNPSYQSLWVQKDIEETEFNVSVVIGSISKVLEKYFNYIQLIVYIGVFLLLLLYYKKLDYVKLIYIIVIIGGFIFYSFWETKAQYTLQYYLMMIPYASIGWNKISTMVIKNVNSFLGEV